MAFEIEMSRSEINFLIGNILEMDFDKDSIFALCPFSDWMAWLKDNYSIEVEVIIYYYFIENVLGALKFD